MHENMFFAEKQKTRGGCAREDKNKRKPEMTH